MDQGTTIMGIIIALICAIPIILSILKSRKKKKKKLEVLQSIEHENSCRVTQYDLFSNSLIGIDTSALLLILIKWEDNKPIIQKVNLKEIKSCLINNLSKPNQPLENIDLILKYHDYNIKDTVLEFFSLKHDGLISSKEIKLAEKWCSIVNNRINVNAKK